MRHCQHNTSYGGLAHGHTWPALVRMPVVIHVPKCANLIGTSCRCRNYSNYYLNVNPGPPIGRAGTPSHSRPRCPKRKGFGHLQLGGGQRGIGILDVTDVSLLILRIDRRLEAALSNRRGACLRAFGVLLTSRSSSRTLFPGPPTPQNHRTSTSPPPLTPVFSKISSSIWILQASDQGCTLGTRTGAWPVWRMWCARCGWAAL